jgi:anti-sigma factor RsiW
MTCMEAEPLLNAYLDGELDLPACLHVERHLADCRTCEAQFASLKRLHEEIADANLRYQPSGDLQRKIRTLLNGSGQPNRFRNNWRIPSLLAAAAAAILLFFFVTARTNFGRPSDGDLEILDSHLRSLTPNHLVDIPSSDHHTVKPWFSGKTSFSPPVPDLTLQGFVLLGGRFEMLQQRPAAALVYKRREHVVNLYISPIAGWQGKSSEEEIGGYHLLRWTRDSLSYVAVSDLNVAELRSFAAGFRGR